MASSLPLPVPPRTPTPPPEDLEAIAQGHAYIPPPSPFSDSFDPNALSPRKENFSSHYAHMSSTIPSPDFPLSATSTNSLYSRGTLDSAGTYTNVPIDAGPFNFQPTPISKTPVTKSVRINCRLYGI